MSVSRIYRVLRLITILQSGQSFTADELAAELEVSRRTIFRDLNMLEMAHIPYYFDESKGGYKISQHFFLPPVNLTIAEALSLLALTGRMRGTTELPLLSQGRRAAIKIESALPDAIRSHVGSVIDSIAVSLSPISRHDGTESFFEQLTQAISQRHVCEITYLSFKDQKQIKLQIHPARLVFKGRAWYVIAWSVLHKEIRTFKLIRIKRLGVSSKVFSPHNVDEQSHFGQAWNMIPEGKLYDIHIHFDKMVAGNVAEVQWHPSQRVVWNDDGSVEFYARVDGIGEIAWWILGYGDKSLVIQPPQLRNHIRDIAKAMLEKHFAEIN